MRSKKRKADFKIPPGKKKKKFDDLVDAVVDFYQPRLSEVADLPLEKKMRIIELNPRLKKLFELFRDFFGV